MHFQLCFLLKTVSVLVPLKAKEVRIESQIRLSKEVAQISTSFCSLFEIHDMRFSASNKIRLKKVKYLDSERMFDQFAKVTDRLISGSLESILELEGAFRFWKNWTL